MRPVLNDQIACGHFVQCECAGFVAADHAGAAEGFNTCKALHDGALIGHTRDADSQGHCGDCWKSFGDAGNSKGDCGQHQIVQCFAADQTNDDN